MRIHHLRSATFVLEAGGHHILIDPMLGGLGTLPPYSLIRHKPLRNPTVGLPTNASSILGRVTHALITHCQKWGIGLLAHTDHLDRPGMNWLRQRQIPVACMKGDAAHLERNGIRVDLRLEFGRPTPWLGGSITAVHAQHGHGLIHHLMANGAGYFIQLPGEPSIYISGDTVLTSEVEHALAELKPDIAVVAAGGAQMDVGGPILMSLEEVVAFASKAPGRVVANHLEALNHCPTTRSQLRLALDARGLLDRTLIPEDGETLDL